ncbi:hypothetical protein GCM10010840_09420 [Deinococcus aerolatus]|uniref:Secreted protein n=1 Tax=Deinococcus aerolatus TaxID=522487 RepID=A0ABQ2G3C2_9DEIO|nr:hypothetical protein GCM10010840_09420 [Deinococcus aerolatus]
MAAAFAFGAGWATPTFCEAIFSFTASFVAEAETLLVTGFLCVAPLEAGSLVFSGVAAFLPRLVVIRCP